MLEKRCPPASKPYVSLGVAWPTACSFSFFWGPRAGAPTRNPLAHHEWGQKDLSQGDRAATIPHRAGGECC
eukprot:9486988-Pyramimonas_sp.AAC.1